jgi:hypothetical protein
VEAFAGGIAANLPEPNFKNLVRTAITLVCFRQMIEHPVILGVFFCKLLKLGERFPVPANFFEVSDGNKMFVRLLRVCPQHSDHFIMLPHLFELMQMQARELA